MLARCYRSKPASRPPTRAFSPSTKLRPYSSQPRRVVSRSEAFIPIHSEPPKDAAVISHKLLTQAGFIRQASAGIYTYLPLAQRTLQKIINIIDEEMQGVGGQKITMPKLLSADLWKQTGRWSTTGEELVRLKDRHNQDYCLAPTHEEVVTFLAANNISSYKQLPLILYQIGEKWRDEARPRFGLVRGREFLMKDMYSFDLTAEAAHKTYDSVMVAYHNVMKRLGIPYIVAEADSGNIGGNKSHEFHALTSIGEDSLLVCECSQYHANTEKAKGRLQADPILAIPDQAIKRAPHSVDALLHESTLEDGAVDAWVFVIDANKASLLTVFVPRGREVNQFLVKSHVSATAVEFFPVRAEGKAGEWSDEARKLWKAADHATTKILIDSSLDPSSGKTEKHAWWAKLVEKLGPVAFGDFRLTKVGDLCPGKSVVAECCGDKPLKEKKGIEVGHLFYLGQKYSKPLNARVFVNGKPAITEMGCFGIGVSRLISTTVETSHDDSGIIWPTSLAPYKAVIIPISKKGVDPTKQAADLYRRLEDTVPGLKGELMLDDRISEGFGFKLKEAELIGYPFIIILGSSYHDDQKFEVEIRKTREKVYLKESELIEFLTKQV